MATIKSYTDLRQSKKLAEILPLESADMYWYLATKDNPKAMFNKGYNEYGDFELSCWSLSALLGVLPILDNRSPVISKTFDRKYRVVYHSTAYEKAILTNDYDNPVDACYELILKLHELNLL